MLKSAVFITLPPAKYALDKVQVRLEIEVLAKLILNAYFFWHEEIQVKITGNLSEKDLGDFILHLFCNSGYPDLYLFSEPPFIKTTMYF